MIRENMLEENHGGLEARSTKEGIERLLSIPSFVHPREA